MKALLIVCLLLTCAPQFAKTRGKSGDAIPRIGDHVSPKWVSIARTGCMTHSAQIDRCFEHSLGGIEFTVAYNEKTKKITYISTEDEKFKTADGLTIGSEIDVSSHTVNVVPGWLVFARRTADGWWPIIGFVDEVKLKDGTVLKFQEKQGSEKGTAVVKGFAKGRLI